MQTFPQKPEPSRTPKAIFLDAAGTLIQTAEPVGLTYSRFAARHGAAFDPGALHRGFKAAFRKLGDRKPGTIPRNGDDRAWWREVVGHSIRELAVPDAFPVDGWFEDLYLHFSKPEAWSVYPEVPAVLAALRKHGIRLAVLSNFDNRLRPVLAGLGLAPHFEQVFISAELGTAKPDLDIYLHALAVMRVRPEEAWMIGDDLTNDVAAPRRVGMGSHRVSHEESGLASLLELLGLLINPRPGLYQSASAATD